MSDEEIGKWLATEEGRNDLATILASTGKESKDYYKRLLDANHRSDLLLHSWYPEYKPFLASLKQGHKMAINVFIQIKKEYSENLNIAKNQGDVEKQITAVSDSFGVPIKQMIDPNVIKVIPKNTPCFLIATAPSREVAEKVMEAFNALPITDSAYIKPDADIA